jgi:hypothetical protein
MIDAVTEREPPIRADADLSQIGEMPIEVGALTALKETPPVVFKATVMLWTWAWRQVPAGTLPDADDALAAMAGLRRDVWCRMREQALTGFELRSDGRLHNATLEAKASAMLAEVEKRERRKADDRRRQKASYDRKKLAQQTGNGTPEPPAETVAASPSDVSTTPSHLPPHLPPASPPPMVAMSSRPNEPVISNDDPVSDGKPHTSNGQTAPTTLAGPQHERAKTETQPVAVPRVQPAIPAGVEIGTPGYPWDPTTFTDEDWDRVVHRYVISGSWAWRSLGPSPRFPECKAPAFVLRKYGYGQQAT